MELELDAAVEGDPKRRLLFHPSRPPSRARSAASIALENLPKSAAKVTKLAPHPGNAGLRGFRDKGRRKAGRAVARRGLGRSEGVGHAQTDALGIGPAGEVTVSNGSAVRSKSVGSGGGERVLDSACSPWRSATSGHAVAAAKKYS